MTLKVAFNNREEDAIPAFSSLQFPTNLIWAFFKRFDFVVSNKVVTTRNKAQTPISGLDKLRMRITKFMNPKSVTEKR